MSLVTAMPLRVGLLWQTLPDLSVGARGHAEPAAVVVVVVAAVWTMDLLLLLSATVPKLPPPKQCAALHALRKLLRNQTPDHTLRTSTLALRCLPPPPL